MSLDEEVSNIKFAAGGDISADDTDITPKYGF